MFSILNTTKVNKGVIMEEIICEYYTKESGEIIRTYGPISSDALSTVDGYDLPVDESISND
jgi:hypothetical protein